MYEGVYGEELVKKLIKLKKKDSNQYFRVRKKMDYILANPEHNYKFLHHEMKGVNRVQMGHFVLAFVIAHERKIVSFEDYDHHDNIYG